MIVVINSLSLELTGGSAASKTNIRQGQSLGFVERIQTNELFGEVLYPDIFHQAAAYMFYIIKNHVFYDGNKRTGLASAITFLQMNGKQFAPWDEEAVFAFVIDVAQGINDPDVAIPKIAHWFKEMSLY